MNLLLRIKEIATRIETETEATLLLVEFIGGNLGVMTLREINSAPRSPVMGADVEVRRECILKALIIYLGERVEDLLKEYMVSQKDQAEQELESTIMAVFVFRENSSLLQQPQGIGIIIDGVEVLNELPSVAAGVLVTVRVFYLVQDVTNQTTVTSYTLNR
ncbi:hypothetical protein MHYP_G00148470 [Metynnis hypsauchen]